MIFVSYSHQDETWRKRFETMAKPRQPGRVDALLVR